MVERNYISDDGMPGLVSVIIPTYNREQLLAEALASVRAQSYRPIEVIVVDDGSTDGTSKFMQECQRASEHETGFSIRFIPQSNQGVSAARNRGLLFARGQYIQFLDSDDLLLPDKLSDAMALFATESDVDLVYALRGEVSSGTREIMPWERQHANLEGDPSPAEVVLSNVWTPLPLLSRRIVKAAGPWDERLPSLEDWEYIGRVMCWVRHARCIPRIQILCRSHAGPRLSINSWGHAPGVQANARASAALYPLVVACGSPRRAEALKTLAWRSLSCLRVAIGAGHLALAREILFDNRELLASRKRVQLEAWLWRMLLYLPESFIRQLFAPLRAIKRRSDTPKLKLTYQNLKK